jgi:hypothetical protein
MIAYEKLARDSVDTHSSITIETYLFSHLRSDDVPDAAKNSYHLPHEAHVSPQVLGPVEQPKNPWCRHRS